MSDFETNINENAEPAGYSANAYQRYRAKQESIIALAKPRSNPGAPIYNPNVWMTQRDLAKVNCYEYAVAGYRNRDAPGIANPGETKFIYNIFDDTKGMGRISANVLREFAVADGLTYAGATMPEAKKGSYVVAGYLQKYDHVDQSVDYHWMRQDADGRWSHKQGQKPVEQVRDSNGKAVTSAPETHDNYKRIGFFQVPNDGLAVGYAAQLNNVLNKQHVPLPMSDEAKNISGARVLGATSTPENALREMLIAHESTTGSSRAIFKYMSDMKCQDPKLSNLNSLLPKSLQNMLLAEPCVEQPSASIKPVTKEAAVKEIPTKDVLTKETPTKDKDAPTSGVDGTTAQKAQAPKAKGVSAPP
jgi:hypothetical protein